MSEKYEQRNLSNSKNIIIWSILWAMSLIVASLSANFFGPLSNLTISLIVLANLAFGVGAIKAHQVWLRDLDEFQRQVQLQSMAFTLGVTWIVVILFQLLDSLGAVPVSDTHITALAVIIALTGSVTTVVRTRQTS